MEHKIGRNPVGLDDPHIIRNTVSTHFITIVKDRYSTNY